MATLPVVQRLLRRAALLLCLGPATLALPAAAQTLPSQAAVPGAPISGPAPPVAPPSGVVPATANVEEMVVDVRFEGNKTVPKEKFLAQVRTKKDRPFDPTLVEEDVRRLNRSRLCVNVRPMTQRVQGGWLVVFQVVERPMLREVRVIGNDKVRASALLKEASLKSGDPMDTFAVEEGRRKIEEYYHKHGFPKARIIIFEGDKVSDTRAVYVVNEGPKQRVLWTSFEGNTIASDARLRTQIQSKPPIAWLFKGFVDREEVDEDVNRLTAYYRNLGFMQAKVGRELEYNANEDWLTLTFIIHEGPRSKVRNVSILGNTKIKTEELSAALKLKRDEWLSLPRMKVDAMKLQEQYGAVGYVFADVKPEVRYLEDPNYVDLVYTMTEGDRYHVGRINVHIKGDNQHTRETAVRDQITLQPGDIVDIRKLRESEKRLRASGLFMVDPMSGSVPKIVFTPPNSDDDTQLAKKKGGYRGQSPDAPSRELNPIITDEPPATLPRTARPTIEELYALPEGVDASYYQPTPDTPPPARDSRFSTADRRDAQMFATNFDGIGPYGSPFNRPTTEPLPRLFRMDASATETGPLMVNRGCNSDTGEASATIRDAQAAASVAESPPVRREWVAKPAMTPAPQRAPGNTTQWAPAGGSPQVQPHTPPTRAEWVVRGQYSSDLAPNDPSRYRPLPGTYRPAAAPPTELPPPTGLTAPAPAYPPAATYPAPASAPPSGYPAMPPGYAPAPVGGYPAAAPPNNYAGGAPNTYTNNPGTAAGSSPAPGSYPPAAGTGPALYGSGAAPAPAWPAPSAPPPVYQPIAPADTQFQGIGPYDSPFNRPMDGTRPLPIEIQTEETQTGRLMLGVGVNSDAGLVGSVILDEQNFDWRRFPRSWDDVVKGKAWRGDGQRFRIEAVPGTEVQRYMINFQDPFLGPTNVSLGLSAFYYDRIFQQWAEQRIGGRISLGYHFTKRLSGSLSFRPEQIGIRNPVDPTLSDFQEVTGNNSLYAFGGTLAHDTRDSPFLATEGHLIQASFEQVLGSFSYPRGEVELRQYFMLWERPDTSGRHVLSLTGKLNVTGGDTPIYDRYYAGGFTTIRGFAFRGVSPRKGVNNTAVGGDAMLLASAEYMFPITADDMLRGVVFCDTGTVQESMKDWKDQYRVAPGFGLRITIPAMGPAPIAFDFAFPVVKQSGDDEQIFSFFLGVLR